MANEVQIQKTVYTKEQFNKAVDRGFKSYVQPEPVEDEITVEQFFLDYEKLYYEIPTDGSEQSHQQLIKRSSELVSFEKDTSDIQPLLEEIAQLRAQNLEAEQQIIDLTSQLASG